ncbi:MAG: MarR family winged helix-turn-helix transcriptional regulator [Gammaproteobacteria bacterium]
MNARLAELGLSQAKWTALLLLGKHPEGIVQRDLACHMDIECASLVGLLDRMAADGWIERRPCEADRRANLVFLSDKSTDTLEEIRRVATEVARDLLGDIPAADLKACQRVLDIILDRAQNLTNTTVDTK